MPSRRLVVAPTADLLAVVTAFGLIACEPPHDKKQLRPVAATTGTPMTLLDGRSVNVSFDRIHDRAAASPEALRQYLVASYWAPGSRAEILSRKSLSEGFSTILEVRHGGALDRAVRELYVMRQLGNAWFACNVVLTDDSMDAPASALCRSLPRPTVPQ